MTEDLDFALKMVHYRNSDNRKLPPDPIQVHGRELTQLLVHVAAEVSRSEIYFDLRPVDRDWDPDRADALRRMLEQLVYDPNKDYEGIRDVAVISALAARMWSIEMAFDRDIGQFGEIIFTDRDGRTVMWAHGYHSHHHPRNPYTTTYDFMPLDEVREVGDWENTGELIADGNREQLEASMRGALGGNVPRPYLNGAKNTVLVARTWHREFRRRDKRDGALIHLRADDRFMQCSSCMARTGTQEQEHRRFPERDRHACPECGNDMVLVKAISEEDEFAQTPRQRLSIYSPYQNKVLLRTVEDIRSAPLIVIKPRDFPGEPMGQSITSEFWSMQTSNNVLDNIALRHMALAIPRFMSPLNDLVDANKQPWHWHPDQGVGMFWKGERPPVPGSVQVIQPQGVPASWGVVKQQIMNRFMASRGTNELSLDPERSRDIPVGTIEAMERIGSLPSEHFIRRTRRQEGQGFGVATDLMRQHYSMDRGVRDYGEDGRYMIELMRGTDFPNVDVVITGNPSFSAVKRDQVEVLHFIAQLPEEEQELAAEALNLNRSVLRRFRQARQQRMEREQKAVAQQQQRNRVPAANGNGIIPAPVAARMGGLNGA